MRRRSRAGGKSAKSQRRKTTTPERRNASKAVRRGDPSVTDLQARLERQAGELIEARDGGAYRQAEATTNPARGKCTQTSPATGSLRLMTISCAVEETSSPETGSRPVSSGVTVTCCPGLRASNQSSVWLPILMPSPALGPFSVSALIHTPRVDASRATCDFGQPERVVKPR